MSTKLSNDVDPIRARAQQVEYLCLFGLRRPPRMCEFESCGTSRVVGDRNGRSVLRVLLEIGRLLRWYLFARSARYVRFGNTSS